MKNKELEIIAIDIYIKIIKNMFNLTANQTGKNEQIAINGTYFIS